MRLHVAFEILVTPAGCAQTNEAAGVSRNACLRILVRTDSPEWSAGLGHRSYILSIQKSRAADSLHARYRVSCELSDMTGRTLAWCPFGTSPEGVFSFGCRIYAEMFHEFCNVLIRFHEDRVPGSSEQRFKGSQGLRNRSYGEIVMLFLKGIMVASNLRPAKRIWCAKSAEGTS